MQDGTSAGFKEWEKGDKRKQHSCFLFHLRCKSPPKLHDWTQWMTWDWARQELCAQWTQWMTIGQAALQHCCIWLSATSIDSCRLSHWMVNKGSSHKLQFVKLAKGIYVKWNVHKKKKKRKHHQIKSVERLGIIHHLKVAEASLEVIQFHYWVLDFSNNS